MSSHVKSVTKGDGQQLNFGFSYTPAPWAAANIRLQEILHERRDLIRYLITRSEDLQKVIKELEAEIYRLKNENEELRADLK